MPDLGDISPWQLLILTATISLVDFAFAVATALVPSTSTTFSWEKVANVLSDHVLKRILPIVALALLSFSVPGAGQAYVFDLAVGGVVLYLGETVVSVSASLHA